MPRLLVLVLHLLLCMFLAHLNADHALGLRGQAKKLRQWRKAKQHSMIKRQTLYAHGEDDANNAGNKDQWWVSAIPVKKDEDYLTASAHLPGSEDLITSGLPGQPVGNTFNFSQYGGYITVDEQAGRALFYYLAEAIPSTDKNSNPSDVPLILWFNGGPGCSSLGYGAFVELGPWHVNNDSSALRSNPFAWNKLANVLFLESPAGVGFSYSNKTSDYSTMGDTPTALDAFTFLINWFQRFPQYQNRTFYIAGESYAGHYVPQLAQTIVAHKDQGHATFINLKGIMVGNGLINSPTDIRGMYTYPWSHALISDKTYSDLMEHCLDMPQHACAQYTDAMDADIGSINLYSIFAPTCHRDSQDLSSTSLPQDQSYLIPGYDPCLENYLVSYLNRRDVQDALHANTTGLSQAWSECSDLLSWNYTDSPESMLPIYQNLISKKYKILVYSGDTDGILPVTSSRESINGLNLTVTTPWKPWFTADEVGGYLVEYEGLTFSTVRGAGHEVPLYQPSRAFTLLQKFLEL